MPIVLLHTTATSILRVHRKDCRRALQPGATPAQWINEMCTQCYEPKLLFMLHWSIKQHTRQYFKSILFTRWPSSCSECNLTPFWQLFSGSWGSLGPHLEPAGRLLGAIWSVLGTFGMCLGASIWSLLHPTRSLLDASGSNLEILEPLGRLLDPTWNSCTFLDASQQQLNFLSVSNI